MLQCHRAGLLILCTRTNSRQWGKLWSIELHTEVFRARENGTIHLTNKSSQIWNEFFIQVKILFRLLCEDLYSFWWGFEHQSIIPKHQSTVKNSVLMSFSWSFLDLLVEEQQRGKQWCLTLCATSLHPKIWMSYWLTRQSDTEPQLFISCEH